MQPGLKILLFCHMVLNWLACRGTGMRNCSPAESFLIAILKKGSYLSSHFLDCLLYNYSDIISGCCRILRGRALYKVTCDFVDAAVKGAVGVINRCIPPINPTDPECFHMWVSLKYHTVSKIIPMEFLFLFSALKSDCLISRHICGIEAIRVYICVWLSIVFNMDVWIQSSWEFV